MTPLVAELDAQGWAVIIGAACVGVGGIVTSVITLVLGYYDRQRQDARDDVREAARIAREEETAKRVEQVRVEAQKTAGKIEMVRVTTDETAAAVESAALTAKIRGAKLDDLKEVATATHGLVNSEHGKALEAVAVLSRWKAGQTGSVSDAQAATAAEGALGEYQSRQQRADQSEPS